MGVARAAGSYSSRSIVGDGSVSGSKRLREQKSAGAPLAGTNEAEQPAETTELAWASRSRRYSLPAPAPAGTLVGNSTAVSSEYG
jgi:hypothetical protein